MLIRSSLHNFSVRLSAVRTIGAHHQPLSTLLLGIASVFRDADINYTSFGGSFICILFWYKEHLDI
jgi:hypothetical protein